MEPSFCIMDLDEGLLLMDHDLLVILMLVVLVLKDGKNIYCKVVG